MIKYYHRIVTDSAGQAYLDAEQQLIAAGASALPFLQQQLEAAVGLGRDVTQVVMERIGANPVFEACLDYLEKAQHRAAHTPMGSPPPEAVASYLVQHFADQVATLLGVYLVKLGPVWPEWKTLAVILYLGRLTGAAAADPLIRLLASAPREHIRNLAVQSLVAVGDAGVLAKIEHALMPFDAARQALRQAADRIRERPVRA